MTYRHPPHRCMNCYDPISDKVFRYSVNRAGHALCPSCQESLNSKLKSTTRETIKLYFSLKKRGVPAELEKLEGFETIDIAVIDAKINIEVDAPSQHCNPREALAELKHHRPTYENGYLTLHIANALVAYNLEETADCITELLSVNNCRQSYHH